MAGTASIKNGAWPRVAWTASSGVAPGCEAGRSIWWSR